MRPIKEKENRQLLIYSGQIISPIASCRNASLRFSYSHRPLWFGLGKQGENLRLKKEKKFPQEGEKLQSLNDKRKSLLSLNRGGLFFGFFGLALFLQACR